jgi:hypothetical protein
MDVLSLKDQSTGMHPSKTRKRRKPDAQYEGEVRKKAVAIWDESKIVAV